MKYSNCTYCPHHRVEPDPDPNDWFNDDDVKVVCIKSFNRPITVACRPHHIAGECETPNWCPLK
jgi:hypothetical protein